MKAIAQVGIPVWLLFISSLVTLAYAGLFATRRRVARLWVLGALTIASTFSTVAAVCMGLAMAGRSGAAMLADEAAGKAIASMVQGVAESFAAGVLGFGTLTLVALLAAIGLWRREAGGGEVALR
jgi:hypothetical protein